MKARRDAVLPQHLADRIVDQLENTERVLQHQFFASDPPRVDGPLQRARLAGLLHHYADRSCRYGLIAADRLDEVHRNVDRIEDADRTAGDNQARIRRQSPRQLALVLDEAHHMAKDVALPKLMKEGRKHGVSVVVASQGAADFHRDVLGNAGTKIVFRANYPASKAVAGFLCGRDGQDLSQQIEQLDVGSAYVATPDHAQARRVYMFT